MRFSALKQQEGLSERRTYYCTFLWENRSCAQSFDYICTMYRERKPQVTSCFRYRLSFYLMNLMNKKKWYVVWVGTEPGVCDSWAECEERIKHYPGAKYKSYPSQTEAVEAFRRGYEQEARQVIRAIASGPQERLADYSQVPEIVADSIAVDAACSGNPGVMEYQGVDVQTGTRLFHVGPFADATNNVGEFLALVHGIAWLYQRGNTHTAVYSDSRNAILWVTHGKCKTKVERTERNAYMFELIARAERWLATHPDYPTRIIKWETQKWGEIPADFGRK